MTHRQEAEMYLQRLEGLVTPGSEMWAMQTALDDLVGAAQNRPPFGEADSGGADGSISEMQWILLRDLSTRCREMFEALAEAKVGFVQCESKDTERSSE